MTISDTGPCACPAAPNSPSQGARQYVNNAADEIQTRYSLSATMLPADPGGLCLRRSAWPWSSSWSAPASSGPGLAILQNLKGQWGKTSPSIRKPKPSPRSNIHPPVHVQGRPCPHPTELPEPSSSIPIHIPVPSPFPFHPIQFPQSQSHPPIRRSARAVRASAVVGNG